MIQKVLKQLMQNSISELSAKGFWGETNIAIPEIGIELSKNPQHGDYATNIALLLAKACKKNPRQVADAIIAHIYDESQTITKAEVAGPGFINLRVSDQPLQSIIPEVLKQGPRYGCSVEVHPKRILVEFVSANPTGPLHLGHARGSFMGDAVARLLSAAGHEVTREFYVNDIGNQMRILGKSIYARYRELFGEQVEIGKDGYPGAYIIDIAKSLQMLDGDHWLGSEEQEWLPRCIEVGIKENLNEIQQALEVSGISFDNWFLESQLYAQSKVNQLIEEYRRRGMLYEAKQASGTDNRVRREESKAAQYAHQQVGGTFLKTSEFGDEEDRIIVRANGQPAYMAGDLAYHWDKYLRGFDRVIDVFGADHAGHLPRLRAGMRALGLADEKLEFLIVQMVRLIRNGKEVRFSKRTGEIYLLRDLIEEVGSDVVRFGFLMRAATTQFDFDLDQALKQSNESPVFYVQYGHARMASLLRRAHESGQAFVGGERISEVALSRLALQEEKNMLKKIAAFPELVSAAAWSLEPHRILHYCQDLIADFHSYFTKYRHSDRIISPDGELTQARLAFVFALKQTLHNALALLGIVAPEMMYNAAQAQQEES